MIVRIKNVLHLQTTLIKTVHHFKDLINLLAH